MINLFKDKNRLPDSWEPVPGTVVTECNTGTLLPYFSNGKYILRSVFCSNNGDMISSPRKASVYGEEVKDV